MDSELPILRLLQTKKLNSITQVHMFNTVMEYEKMLTDWISRPSEAIDLMDSDPEKMCKIIQEGDIDDVAMASIIYEWFDAYQDRLEPLLPMLINRAKKPIHEALLWYYKEDESKYEERLKKSLLDFTDDEIEQYMNRLKLYLPHIHDFRSWAMENDLVRLCFKGCPGQDEAIYLISNYDLPFKGLSLTETARIILDKAAKDLVELNQAFLSLDLREGLNSSLLRLATILSPNFILTPFIDTVIRDPDGDHIRAWNEALSKATYLEWKHYE